MIALIILSCLIVYGLYNTKKAVWMLMFLIMAIPLGTIAPNINTTLLLRIGSVSVFEIAIILYTFLLFVKYPTRVKKYLTLSVLLLFFYIACVFTSIFKYGFSSTFADAKDYIIAILWMLLVFKISNGYTFDDFCLLTLKAVFFANAIILIGYLITYHTILPSSQRFGFSVQALCIFTVPYIIYCIFIKRKYKRWMIAELFLQLYMLTISQNRTNPCIIVIIIVTMIIYYLLLNRNISKSEKNKWFNFSLIFVFMIIVAIVYVGTHKNVKNGYLGRINEMLQGNFTTDSTEMRDKNIDFYTKKIMNTPQGVGFGAYMPALSIHTTGYDDTTLLNYGFDNAYLTITYKCGIAGVVLYALFLFQQVFWAFKQRKRGYIYFLVLLVLLGMILSGTCFTIQLVKSINVYGFYMALIIFFREKEHELDEN